MRKLRKKSRKETIMNLRKATSEKVKRKKEMTPGEEKMQKEKE